MRAAGKRYASAAEILLPLLLIGLLNALLVARVGHDPTFPLPRLMTSSIDTGKFLAFTRMKVRTPALDVVFLGISPMMRVDGRHLQSYMAERWRRPFRSFNFAAPYHSIELDRHLLADIVLPVEAPKVVVYGLTPINLLYERDPAVIERIVERTPAFSLEGNAPSAMLRNFLIRHVPLFEYREVVRDMIDPSAKQRPDPWTKRARQTDSFGDLPLLNLSRPIAGVAAWEQKYARQFEEFSATLRSTRVFDHLERLAAFCQEHDLRLVIVANAVHPLFLTLLPHGRSDYDAYLGRLRDTAEQAGVLFFDPADGGIGRPEFFQDTHHHNLAGSEWLSERIGEFLIERGLLDRGGTA